jgi:hypothetical protein
LQLQLQKNSLLTDGRQSASEEVLATESALKDCVPLTDKGRTFTYEGEIKPNTIRQLDVSIQQLIWTEVLIQQFKTIRFRLSAINKRKKKQKNERKKPKQKKKQCCLFSKYLLINWSFIFFALSR